MIFRVPKLGIFLLLQTLVVLPLSATEAVGENSQAVAAVMAAEYALQKEDVKTAAIEYTKAALASDDVSVAEHAARLAMNVKMTELARQALGRWRELAPDSATMWALSLNLAIEQGEAEAAFIYARKLLSYNKAEYSDALFNVLKSEKADDGVMSRAVLRTIARDVQNSDNLQVWIQLLILADTLEEPDAKKFLGEHIALKFPDDSRALVFGATALREKGDAASALAMTQRATTLLPQNAWVKQSIMAEFVQLQAWLEAEKYLATGPQDEDTLWLRGGLVLAAKQKENSEKFYAMLLRKEKSPTQKIQLLLGQLSESSGRWADAERWYRAVIVSPEREQASLRLPVMMQKQNRSDEAMSFLRNLQNNADTDGEFVRDCFLVESQLWVEQGNDVQAMKTLDRGLLVFEGDPLLLYARAMQQVNQNRIDAGLADLKKIIDDNDQNAEALNAYGYTLAQHTKRYSQALPYVEKALKLRPGSASAMDSLGWIKLMQQQYDQALLWLEKAWNSSKDAEIAAHLGEAYWQLGRKDEARKIWLLGQAIDPRYAFWSEIRKKYSP